VIVFIVLYAVMSLADVVLTIIGLSKGLPELNFFMLPWYNAFGAVGIVAYKVILVGMISLSVYFWWNSRAVRILAWFAALALALVVISNFMVVTSIG
jgi:hypothetical protein